jgi:hypothetical protein
MLEISFVDLSIPDASLCIRQTEYFGIFSAVAAIIKLNNYAAMGSINIQNE